MGVMLQLDIKEQFIRKEQQMLKKYQVTKMVDDFDGSQADRTIRFSIDGAHYEIDLSKENADKFREVFAPYIANGRRVTSRKSSRKTSSASTGLSDRRLLRLGRGPSRRVTRRPREADSARPSLQPTRLRTRARTLSR